MRALLLAAAHPDRINGAFLIGAAVPCCLHPHPTAPTIDSTSELDSYEGWASTTNTHWLQDYRDFLEFFSAEIFTEPHSTKQIEDGVAWGLDTTPRR